MRGRLPKLVIIVRLSLPRRKMLVVYSVEHVAGWWFAVLYTQYHRVSPHVTHHLGAAGGMRCCASIRKITLMFAAGARGSKCSFYIYVRIWIARVTERHNRTRMHAHRAHKNTHALIHSHIHTHIPLKCFAHNLTFNTQTQSVANLIKWF